MSAKFQEFCGHAVAALSSGTPLPESLDAIAIKLSELLADAAFVSYAWTDADPPGRRLLHRDPQAGFYVLAHAHRVGKTGLPHSHGASWAIYGVARGYTDMIEWRRINPEEDGPAILSPAHRYRLAPGETRAYGPHLIHSTAHPDGAWVIRVTGADLDKLPRFQFNPKRDRMVEHA